MTNNVFSEFEVKNTSIKFDGENGPADKIGCVGSLEETMNTKVISKKCEGVVKKQVVKGDGTGELKLSVHMKYEHYAKTYGLVTDGYKEGVYAYGQNSVHKPFCLTAEVFDEDGEKKLKAYPHCVITTGIARKIENGAEEVAEIELTITVMPDDDGNGMYECLVTDSTDASLVNSWITNFAPTLIKATA